MNSIQQKRAFEDRIFDGIVTRFDTLPAVVSVGINPENYGDIVVTRTPDEIRRDPATSGWLVETIATENLSETLAEMSSGYFFVR